MSLCPSAEAPERAVRRAFGVCVRGAFAKAPQMSLCLSALQPKLPNEPLGERLGCAEAALLPQRGAFAKGPLKTNQNRRM